MMPCPKCRSKSFVLETRSSNDMVRRRRECPACDHRWTTLEAFDTDTQVAKLDTTVSRQMKALQKRTRHLEAELVDLTNAVRRNVTKGNRVRQ